MGENELDELDEIDELDKLDLSEIIEIEEWKTSATDYPEKEYGSARISKGKYTKGIYHNYGVRGYKYFIVDKPICITSMDIKDESGLWKTWMVDNPPHWWSMQDYSANSLGRVLVAGLGLGLVTGELLNNVDVDSITVIERNEDVIGLIAPFLPEAIDVEFEILEKDFYGFINETDKIFDRIIIDLWVTGSAEETMRVYNDEVRPLAHYMRKLFPDASVVFHGFGLSW